MTYEMDHNQHQSRLLRLESHLHQNLAVHSPEHLKDASLDTSKRNISAHLSNLIHPESGGDRINKNNVFSPVNSIATPPSVFQQQGHSAHVQQQQQLQQQQQQPLSPFNVEQNMSYTRGEFSQGLNLSRPYSQKNADSGNASNASTTSHITSLSMDKTSTDEDERFLRLAREALVATALTGRVIVDPTIQDLLQRLQYASSPHGNPIKHSGDIRANEYGQLMIQGFYRSFPNLSNDIFTGSPSGSPSSNYQQQPNQHQQQQSHTTNIHQHEDDLSQANISTNHPSNMHNDGWNFLLDESDLLNRNRRQRLQNQQPHPILSHELHQDQGRSYNDDNGDDGNEDDADMDSEGSASILGNGQGDSGGGPGRTFICPDCQMSFKRSSDLKRHEKQHLSIPPNICELCGKGFARKDALKRHFGTLTCKRNAEKKAYIDNLKYVKK